MGPRSQDALSLRAAVWLAALGMSGWGFNPSPHLPGSTRC